MVLHYIVSSLCNLHINCVALSVSMVDAKLSSLSATFRRKSNAARDASVRRWLHSHRFSIRVSTHESQRNPQETMDMSIAYIESLRPRLLIPGREKRWVFNMDQTPLFFSMTPRRTLAQTGSRTVNVRSSSSSTMRVTVAVTITADGGVLKPMIVYKGSSYQFLCCLCYSIV